MIIALPRWVFPKREGRSPPSLVVSRLGDFQGGREIEIPSPLNGVLWILSFAKERKYPVGGKKKKQRNANGRGRAPPLHTGFRRSFRRGRCPRSGAKRNKSPWGASPPTYRLPKAYAYPTGRTEPSAPTTGFPAANALSKPNQRPKAATYLCRFAAKARFDNRPTPEGVSKEGGPQPSLFGRFKERGFLRGEGNRNPSPLKPFFGYFLSGKKVTRRRHKKKGKEEKCFGRGRALSLHSAFRKPVRIRFGRLESSAPTPI